MADKSCSKCKQTKDVSEFNKRRRASDGLDFWCKECNKKSCNAYNRSNAGQTKARKRNLERYSLSVSAYENLLKGQGFVCAICKHPETKSRKSGKVLPLAVDHSHTTGKVRGLLCNNCNRGLGLLGDSRAILSEAVRYLDGEG